MADEFPPPAAAHIDAVAAAPELLGIGVNPESGAIRHQHEPASGQVLPDSVVQHAGPVPAAAAGDFHRIVGQRFHAISPSVEWFKSVGSLEDHADVVQAGDEAGAVDLLAAAGAVAE